jgi:methylmalonyl-CoA mutase cobalamin-binding subunit
MTVTGKVQKFKIKEMGIAEFFPRGTTLEELIDWARDHIKPAGHS